MAANMAATSDAPTLTSSVPLTTPPPPSIPLHVSAPPLPIPPRVPTPSSTTPFEAPTLHTPPPKPALPPLALAALVPTPTPVSPESPMVYGSFSNEDETTSSQRSYATRQSNIHAPSNESNDLVGNDSDCDTSGSTAEE
ncbi:classical arabinogalactan protein 9-like [Malania oleifera]|uniref:classical arabinogalactan protein 9-like n=1 Tax=Malania oleifera TaxID=397392 RepID=UPI0025ADF5D3|nr:classical arabinogalactan protein 9-like [Malania oleifera]